MEHIQSYFASIAFGLLLALVGHDAHLSAQATPPEPSGSATDVECGPITGIQPQASNDPGGDDTPAIQEKPGRAQGISGFSPHWSVEPDHPPAIRRALLQVYLN